MKFAKTYGIQCLGHGFGEPMHPAFEVPHDTYNTRCPECDREIDLSMFRAANRAIVVAIELAEARGINNFAWMHGYQEGGDDIIYPSQMVAERIDDLFRLDMRITSMSCRWDDIYKITLLGARAFGSESSWMMEDVFKHPLLSTCGEGSPLLGSLAPVVAGLNIWNTACELARYDSWLVFPRFDNLEIWHDKADE